MKKETIEKEVVKRVCVTIHNSFIELITKLDEEIVQLNNKLNNYSKDSPIQELNKAVTIETERNLKRDMLNAFVSVCKTIKKFEENNFNGSGNITTTGKVGIGTESPTFPLEVVDSSVPMSVVRSAAFTDRLLTTFSGAHKTSGDMVDGFGPMLNFRIEDNDGVTNNYIGGIGAMRDGHDKSGAIVIRNYLEGVSAERMRVSANGNVGIGTDSPDSLLHVNGISEFEGIINTNGNWIRWGWGGQRV